MLTPEMQAFSGLLQILHDDDIVTPRANYEDVYLEHMVMLDEMKKQSIVEYYTLMTFLFLVARSVLRSTCYSPVMNLPSDRHCSKTLPNPRKLLVSRQQLLRHRNQARFSSLFFVN